MNQYLLLVKNPLKYIGNPNPSDANTATVLSSVLTDMDITAISQEFIVLMSVGVNLLAVTASGEVKAVHIMSGMED